MPFLLLWHPRSTAGPRPPPRDLNGDLPLAKRPRSDDDEAVLLVTSLLKVITDA